MNCPLCFQPEPIFLFSTPDKVFTYLKKEFFLYRCSNCTVIFLTPQPPKKELAKHYPSDYNIFDNFIEDQPRSLFKKFIRQNTIAYWLGYGNKKAWQIILYPYFLRLIQYPKYQKQGRLLDIGCGNGRFLWEMKQLGWQVVGTDLSPIAVEVAQNHGLEIYCGTIENLKFKKESFDAIVLHHVLEHLPQPDRSLTQIKRILKPTGELIITVPNTNSLVTKTFGTHWFGWELPRHLFHFNIKSLSQLLIKKKFSITAVYSTSFLESLPQSLNQGFSSPFFKNKLFLKAASLFSKGTSIFFNPFANSIGWGDTITIKAKKNE